MQQLNLFFEQRPNELPHRILSIDVEGTGDKLPDLVELAIVGISTDFNVEHGQAWLMKPEHKITWFAKKIHGISNKSVSDLPNFNHFESCIREALGINWVVAHNAAIDYRMMKRKLPDWSPLGVIDTLKLARKVFPGMPTYKLSALVAACGLEQTICDCGTTQAHRALYDARACAFLFLHLLREAQNIGTTIPDFLEMGKFIPKH